LLPRFGDVTWEDGGCLDVALSVQTAFDLKVKACPFEISGKTWPFAFSQ